MRKLVYLPHHLKDRLLKYRQRHEMVDEGIAIMRLISRGLDEVEKEELKKPEPVEKEEEPYRPNWAKFWVDPLGLMSNTR